MSPVEPKGQRFRALIPLAFTFMALTVSGCDLDLDVRARADVRLDDSHTLHVSYRREAPSGTREPSRP
jgi:hypothetical protein